MITEEEFDRLQRQYAVEADSDPDLIIMLPLKPREACAIVHQLGLALNHPENVGTSARTGREAIDLIVRQFMEREMPACATMCRLGVEEREAPEQMIVCGHCKKRFPASMSLTHACQGARTT